MFDGLFGIFANKTIQHIFCSLYHLQYILTRPSALFYFYVNGNFRHAPFKKQIQVYCKKSKKLYILRARKDLEKSIISFQRHKLLFIILESFLSSRYHLVM